MSRRHVEEEYHDEENEEAPPSYAEATGSRTTSNLDSSVTRNQPPIDEKRRFRQSLPALSLLSLPRPSVQYGDLTFTVDFKKSMLDFWTLTLAPTSPWSDLPYWQLRYSTRHSGTLHRHASEPQSSFPLKEVAKVEFPKAIWPGCGPTITFWPHEEEIERRGLRHVSATDRFMECSGWISTKYGLDLPALGSARVVWKVPKDKESVQDAASVKSPQQSPNARRASSTSGTKSPFDLLEPSTPKVKSSPSSWTPFPTQHLVEEVSGRLLATYNRSAPWSRHTGYLTITAKAEQPASAELIEHIVIITAAMVGMQDAIGLASSLVESGIDSFKGKGKGKSKDAG